MGIALTIVAILAIVFVVRYSTFSTTSRGEDAPVSFYSKVVGVSFKNPDGTQRQELIQKHCRSGQMLILSPEPNNPKDPNAVAVHIAQGQIGYIMGGRLAEDISGHLQAGRQVTAHIKEITGGNGRETYGVNISIHITRQ